MLVLVEMLMYSLLVDYSQITTQCPLILHQSIATQILSKTYHIATMIIIEQLITQLKTNELEKIQMHSL